MSVDTSGDVARHKARHESRREREFYRYYEALRNLSSEAPNYCDLNDATAVEAHRPRSSPDKALTAFCQLGALRLNARRAMTFFFDNDAAYVLAESTRTLSLEHDSVHEEGDQLWLGYSVIPRFCSVCEYTVELSPTDCLERNELVNIVDDLREDTRFHDRPFVINKPNARFYAGVPITTASGVNIGAYCVLDDAPRSGLDSISTSFLHDMAATIMSHLEIVRAKAERKRATQMVDGLGAFVRSTSRSETVDSWHLQGRSHEASKQPASANPRSSLNANHPSAHMDSAAPTRKRRSAPKRSSTEPPFTPGSRMYPDERMLSNVTQRMDEKYKPSRPESTAADARTMFQRASELIREAIDMDAVAFLDTSVGHDGGLLQRLGSPVEAGRSSTREIRNKDFLDRRSSQQWPSLSTNRGTRRCSVLGSSHARGCGEDETTRDVDSHEAPITEGLLLTLLDRYPRGKCWNFDKAGCALSSRESSNESSESLPDDSDLRKMSQSQETYDDGEDIYGLFPGIRSFALVGMWDQEQSRWFSACAIWSYEPLRILSDEYEVNFLAAFAEVIMTEVHRLRLQVSTKSKSDFISSISHELRSPLHGILGSVECLQESEMDQNSSELVTQIDICGRTLLDIIDHLLDFSNINHYAQRSDHHAEEGNDLQRTAPTSGNLIKLGGTASLNSDASLDVVTEEIVAATVYSYCCSKDPKFILNRKVSVICNIDCAADMQWMCHLPTGSWKRLCINLVNNALKFTSSGHITVTLSAVAPQDPLKAFDAILEVSDTGCGMSAGFLKNHLFEAFVQEDGLIEGTGLGMSLVAKIVKAFGGRIEVQSERHVGTTITIVLPVDRAQSSKGSDAARCQTRSLPNASVIVVDTEPNDPAFECGINVPIDDKLRHSKHLLLSSIRATCVGLGLNSAMFNLDNAQTPDICIITEGDLLALDESAARNPMSDTIPPPHQNSKAVIVICDSTISKRRMVGSPSKSLEATHVDYVAQPVGPDRLVKAIQACLRATQITITTISASSSTHEPCQAGARNGSLSNVGDAASDLANRSSGAAPTDNSQPLLARRGSPREDIASKTHKGQNFIRPVTAIREDGNPLTPTAWSTANMTAPQQRINELCLLLVDDNEINLKLLVMYAQKQNYDMLTARTGLQAVESYKTTWNGPNGNIQEVDSTDVIEVRKQSHEKIQVVLMDINMPVMNGFEATRQIRRFEQQVGMEPAFIIALTGLGNASAQTEAYNCGMNGFMTKPVSFKKLTQTLRAIQCS